jgi:hypothetical protein
LSCALLTSGGSSLAADQPAERNLGSRPATELDECRRGIYADAFRA